MSVLDSTPEPEPEHPIDRLVRRHLQRQADTVDASALLRRVRRQTERAAPLAMPLVSRRRWRRVLVGLAATAAVLLAFLGGRLVGPAQAQPDVLLREASQAHALPIDRCYLVEIVPDQKGPMAGRTLFGQPRKTLLWTRGDRFWLESIRPDRRWSWGQDDQSNIWVALGGQRGVQFAPGEAPEGIALAAEVCTLQPETLLNLLRTRTDLRRESSEGSGPVATWRIRARPRRGHGLIQLRSAVIDVDAETRVLRRLVLERNTRDGRPLATVTFTLIDSQPQDDLLYQLRGHLANPDAPAQPPKHARNDLPNLLGNLLK